MALLPGTSLRRPDIAIPTERLAEVASESTLAAAPRCPAGGGGGRVAAPHDYATSHSGVNDYHT